MLGLLLTECGSCKKDVAATHPVSQDPACDQTDHHQRRHHILLMSSFPMLLIRLIIVKSLSQCPNQHYFLILTSCSSPIIHLLRFCRIYSYFSDDPLQSRASPPRQNLRRKPFPRLGAQKSTFQRSSEGKKLVAGWHKSFDQFLSAVLRFHGIH